MTKLNTESVYIAKYSCFSMRVGKSDKDVGGGTTVIGYVYVKCVFLIGVHFHSFGT